MVRITINNELFNATQEQADAYALVTSKNTSGFAFVKLNLNTSGYVEGKEKLSDMTIHIGADPHKRDLRTLKSLELLTFNKVETSKVELMKGKDIYPTEEEQFNFCLNNMITKLKEKMETQAEGKYNLKSGALNQHQKGKLVNNRKIKNGIEANLVNTIDGEKNLNSEGHQVPVLDADGVATIESFVFQYVYSKVKTIKEGVRKTKKSGSKVQMDNAIKKALPKNINIKSCTLKNCAYISLANDAIVNGILEEEKKDDLKFMEA